MQHRDDAVLKLPPLPPAELVAFLGFVDRLHEQTRRLRDEGALPRLALTLPDAFDPVLDEMVPRIREQVAAAPDAAAVSIRLPVTPMLVELVEWVAIRWELMTGVVRAGLVDEAWHGPMRTWLSLMSAAAEQLLGRALPDDPSPD